MKTVSLTLAALLMTGTAWADGVPLKDGRYIGPVIVSIDGKEADDKVIETLLGIRLSHHPVRALILGQHNLAYLFSATRATCVDAQHQPEH